MDNPPLVSPTNPHFFQPLLPGFETYISIPLVFFSNHIQGKSEDQSLVLRSDVCEKIWKVNLERRRLTRGWNEFTTAHNLRIGDIVIFKHEGDLVFNVTPFGPSCTKIQYSDSQIKNETPDTAEDDENDRLNGVSFDYCFVAKVIASNVKLCLPVAATGCSALNKQRREIILVNKDGNPWTVSLRFRESGGLYYISKGWRRFCLDNGSIEGDSFLFNLVGDGKSTPLLCVCPDAAE